MPTGVYERTERVIRKMCERTHTKKTKEKMSKAHRRERNNGWNGGFKHETDGYIKFLVPEDCRFSCMRDNLGYVLVHRLVMADYLQRPLKPEEVVHHINGDITDNRIENLMLFQNDSKHQVYHWKLRKIEEEPLCR